MLPIIDVRDDAALARLEPEWLAADAVAIDTEFVRERTFYPRPGLIQICAGDTVHLVDPLTIEDLSPLRRLLQAPVIKVLHSASEDLEVFQRLLGTVPAPLADTQVGAALAGLRFGLGYQALVQELLGEELDKGETRSDWLHRPLSESQRRYAAMDVAWLLPVYRQLHQRLRERERLSWWWEEGARTVLEAERPQRPEQAWRRLKGAGRLQPRQLSVLRALCSWREGEARGRDLPRGHVLKDAVCLELARRAPADRATLSACEGITPRLVEQYGAALLAGVAQGNARPASEWPEVVPQLDRARGGELKQLRQVVTERAQALDVAPELLARRRDLEALLQQSRLPQSLEGWRREAVGEALLERLERLPGVIEGGLNKRE